VCASLLLQTGFAQSATSPTPAEIDRLRMHADAGRDDRALDALLAAARTGLADAQRAAGEALVRRADGKRVHEGISWLEHSAAQGDPRAMLALGKLWLLGAAGVAPDAAKARMWFAQVDAASFPQAAYYLGLIEKNGSDQLRNSVRAAAHFRFGAERGVSEAMYLLGNAYATGDGVDAEPREAMRWYLRAAALEHPQAIQELAYAFARGDTLLPQSDLQAANMRLAMEHALRHPKAAP
jgi:uncharacterized protein